ncbi:MAG TPA: hypothetical protein VMI94_27055 [Bryobacteraceae bacterium]|nr:hypothetical protein [Bryobacteraceae bacterium]
MAEVTPVRLKPETLQAYDDYIRSEESAMDQTLLDGVFLWSDREPARARRVAKGDVLAEYTRGKGPHRVPSGLIHDWIGAALIPHAGLPETLATIQNYDDHKDIYKPEVIDSRLIGRQGDDFQIYLRVLKKKIITVVVDTDHDVHYYQVDGKRGGCRSRTTRSAEVDDAGEPNEIVHPPDTGYGFLWRLNSYWRFAENDGGVTVECRAITLTRDIPAVLRLVIDPIVRSLPKEALIQTLRATRDAIRGTRQNRFCQA